VQAVFVRREVHGLPEPVVKVRFRTPATTGFRPERWSGLLERTMEVPTAPMPGWRIIWIDSRGDIRFVVLSVIMEINDGGGEPVVFVDVHQSGSAAENLEERGWKRVL
jgi:hypothetical protein